MIERLMAFDVSLFLWMNRFAGTSADYFFAWPTHLATPVLYGMVLMFLLIWEREKPAGKILLVTAAGLSAGLVNSCLKALVDRPRPCAYFADAIASGKVELHPIFNTYFSRSFPSGHTVTAFAVAAALNVLYPKKLWWLYGLAAYAGLTRVYVGAHFPSDVLAGALAGALTGFAVAVPLKKYVTTR